MNHQSLLWYAIIVMILTCNGKHIQWFSDEVIARRTCDELNAKELKENK